LGALADAHASLAESADPKTKAAAAAKSVSKGDSKKKTLPKRFSVTFHRRVTAGNPKDPARLTPAPPAPAGLARSSAPGSPSTRASPRRACRSWTSSRWAPQQSEALLISSSLRAARHRRRSARTRPLAAAADALARVCAAAWLAFPGPCCGESP